MRIPSLKKIRKQSLLCQLVELPQEWSDLKSQLTPLRAEMAGIQSRCDASKVDHGGCICHQFDRYQMLEMKISEIVIKMNAISAKIALANRLRIAERYEELSRVRNAKIAFLKNEIS